MFERNYIISAACIAICLAAIAFLIAPVLFTVTWGPRPRQVCLSNLKQLNLACLQYEQDNDEMLPPRQNMSGPDHSLVSWRYLLYPYVKSRSRYQCPTNPAASTATSLTAPLTIDDLSSSYAVNSTHDDARCFGPFADKFHKGFPMAKADAPDQTIAIVESTAAFNDFNPLFPEGFARSTNAKSRVGNLFSGHHRQTNVAFLDGHVHSMTPAQIRVHQGGNPWTVDGAPFSSHDQARAANTLKYSERTYQNSPDDMPQKQIVLGPVPRS